MKKKTRVSSILKNHKKQLERLKKRSEKKPRELLTETRYLYSLLETTLSINTPQDFNQLLEHIVDSAITLTRGERGFLMLYRDDGNLEFRVMRNIDKKTLEGEEFEISRTVVNQVLATGGPIFLSDIYGNKSFKISDSIEALGLRMVMCVPLKAKDKILGVIYVDSHSESEKFTHLEEKMFKAFAAQASVTIENSHLYDSSVHDALTGLYNYGYLRARLSEEINRASRYKKENISFMMIDLDKFKLINDSYGHLFGNSVLLKVAELIKMSVRKYDVVARYGGDEFGVLMPDSDAQAAQYLAQRLQKEIAELKFSFGKTTFSVSASIGISTFPAEQITDSESVIVEADHALFVAKSKGGNQIAVFGLRKDDKKHEQALIGESEAINEIRQTIFRLAKTDTTILITGETGTGKELATKLLHQNSPRSSKRFVVVNCGAIPDNLLESELFGYEKGAFTGAYRQHKGKFETAHGGTIFLDEIGDLPLHLQVKLLRAIEQKEIDRIGGKSPIKVNVRVIVATNKNLEDEVKKGSFRKDLFYRLSVATIHLHPLREKLEDIEALSDFYLDQMNKRYHRKFLGITKTGKEAMMLHQWPGNVRELIHRIERAVIMGKGEYLDESDLGLTLSGFEQGKSLKELKDSVEKESITQSLMRHRWNITRAAKMLQITPKALRYLIKKHKLLKPKRD
jgi:diguanylate cyclase (GGDEF)-like protein